MNPKLIPTIMIILNVLAAAGYYGDIRKMIYFLSAAALTTCVTY